MLDLGGERVFHRGRLDQNLHADPGDNEDPDDHAHADHLLCACPRVPFGHKGSSLGTRPSTHLTQIRCRGLS